MTASVLGAAILAVFEMGPALAKLAFKASDAEVALVTSGQSLGLIFSFFIAHMAAHRRKMPLVFWPEVLLRLILGLTFFLKATFALGFVILHALAQMLQSMTIPARVTIYRLNYPTHLRGRVVGRNRQIQLLFTALVALAMSAALEWSRGRPELVQWWGKAPVDPVLMVNYMIPSIAFLGLVGTLIFRLAPVRGEGAGEPAAGRNGAGALAASRSMMETARLFLRVWREDRDFRRYETFFLIFGFANIMSIPLTQIHCVDHLHANYFDLALINVILVQGLMAVTMVFWGKLVDRYPPTMLRAILNIIFAMDLLALAFAPSLGWVFAGRAFRGIALGGGTLIWMLGSLYYARSQAEVPIYLGIHTVLTGMRWAVAPFAGVLLKDLAGENARPIFFLSFLIVVGTALWMIVEARRETPRKRLEIAPMPAPRTPGA